MTFEATITDMINKEAADIVFMGSGGRLNIFRYGYRFLPAASPDQPVTAGGGQEVAHMANWLDSIRTRKQPNANVVDGHYGAMACHIGNMAYKRNNRVAWRKEWDV